MFTQFIKLNTFFILTVVLFLNACMPLTMLEKDNFIRVVGTATISEQRGETLEDKQFRAMRASKLDAYKELSEQVYGIRIESISNVNDQKLDVDLIKGSASGLIRAAEVIASYPVGDSYVTEMKLDLSRMKLLSELSEVYTVPANETIIF